MTNKIKNSFHSLIPKIEKEEISLETETILEIFFFKIFEVSAKLTKTKIERTKGSSTGNFFIDLILIFLILEMVTQTILILPLLLTPDDPSKDFVSIQVLVIVLFCSIAWTGFVYLISGFRDIIETKIIPILKKYHYPHDSGFYDFIRQFFNGTCLKWRSGRSFRFHLRSLFYFIILIPIWYSIFKILEQSFFALYQTPNVTTFVMLIFFIFMFILMAWFLFVIAYILLTIMAIFFFLFMVASGLEIEINPLIDMGGTQKFGEIIVNSLFLISFGLACLPTFLILSKIQSIPKTQFTQFSNQTIGNISMIIKNNALTSVNEMSIGSLS